MNIKKLKILMLQNDCTPKDLANLLNLKGSAIYNRLNGRRKFTIREAITIADYFETTLDDLCSN